MGKSVGFSLEEIRAMLDLYDVGDGQVTQLKVALARFREQIDRLAQQRRDIDRAIAELKRASEIVAGKLEARGA
jgi:DNA-binding transcriptional MerR regulator